MNTLSYEARIERLNTFITEGRVLRGKWRTTEADGRELACLLAALSPEAGFAKGAAACPASVMPAWLAHLTPSIDDNVSTTYWPEMLLEYAKCAALWPGLDEKAWRRVQAKALVAALDVALPHAGSPKPAVEAVRTLCARASLGDEPTPVEWAEAREAAEAAEAAAEAGAATWDAIAKALFAAIREEAAAREVLS